MAATYFDHEQQHARPGLMWFLMAMVWVFPILAVIAAFAFSFKGSST
jgi:hypothetical protein